MSKLNILIRPLGKSPAKQVRIASDSFEQSAENVDICANKYGYEPWRVRVMDAQRSSVHFVNSIGKDPSELASATLLYQANGYSFSTANNASVNDKRAKIVTPYSVLVDGEGGAPLRKRAAQLLYNDQPILGFDSFRLFDIMSAVSLNRRDIDSN